MLGAGWGWGWGGWRSERFGDCCWARPTLQPAMRHSISGPAAAGPPLGIRVGGVRVGGVRLGVARPCRVMGPAQWGGCRGRPRPGAMGQGRGAWRAWFASALARLGGPRGGAVADGSRDRGAGGRSVSRDAQGLIQGLLTVDVAARLTAAQAPRLAAPTRLGLAALLASCR